MIGLLLNDLLEQKTEAFDTGAFNEIALGYLGIAMDSLSIPKETQDELFREMYYTFDMHTAEEALNFYNHRKI